MFFDDVKTLYDLDAPDSGRIKVEQTYSDYRKGRNRAARLARLPAAAGSEGDRPRHRRSRSPRRRTASRRRVKLDVPIVDDKQSAHIKITGTIKDRRYKVTSGELVFDRTLHGLRNTVLLPAGWEVSAVSQSGTIGTYQGRAFVALINLNAREQLPRDDSRAQADVMTRVALAAIVLAALASGAEAQRGRGRAPQVRVRTPADSPYDGAFRFCRIAFRNSPAGDGAGWFVDYPRADQNLTFRFSELTKAIVSRDVAGQYNHLVIALTDPELYRCPFVMMTEPGGAYFDDDEAAALREYLARGGFLWADDFWGDYAFNAWAGEIGKALPPYRYPIVDLPISHPIFHLLYDMQRIPQIPSINFWIGTGGRTSERGRRERRAARPRDLRRSRAACIVLMTHNTDFGDAFEREGDDHAVLPRVCARRVCVRRQRAAVFDDALALRHASHHEATNSTRPQSVFHEGTKNTNTTKFRSTDEPLIAAAASA